MNHKPWNIRLVEALSNPPKKLYHVAHVDKLEKYENAGQIYPPVRGFDTLEGAKEHAKSFRHIILEIEVDIVQALPDYHNKYGLAWFSPLHIKKWKVLQNGAK